MKNNIYVSIAPSVHPIPYYALHRSFDSSDRDFWYAVPLRVVCSGLPSSDCVLLFEIFQLHPIKLKIVVPKGIVRMATRVDNFFVHELYHPIYAKQWRRYSADCRIFCRVLHYIDEVFVSLSCLRKRSGKVDRLVVECGFLPISELTLENFFTSRHTSGHLNLEVKRYAALKSQWPISSCISRNTSVHFSIWRTKRSPFFVLQYSWSSPRSRVSYAETEQKILDYIDLVCADRLVRCAHIHYERLFLVIISYHWSRC